MIGAVMPLTVALAMGPHGSVAGSASALMGAVGASLAAMVAGLTLGKEKYREYEAQTQRLQAEGNRMKARFLELIDQVAVPR